MSTSKIEQIGFRVVLVVWFISFFIIGYSGYIYIRAQAAINNFDQIVDNYQTCSNFQERILFPDKCPIDQKIPTGQYCDEIIISKCGTDPRGSSILYTIPDMPEHWGYEQILLYLGIGLLAGSSFLFYAIKFITTGHIKPLIPIGILGTTKQARKEID